MKKILLSVAALLFGWLAQGQTIYRGTDFGFTFVTNIAASTNRSIAWTNDNAYPFKIASMVFNSDVANTAVVSRIKNIVEYEMVGDVVTTNDMGGIETNYSYTVTNTVTTALTNTLLSVTNAGSAVYQESDLAQIYIHLGDIIHWSFSDTNEIVIIFDAMR
jgi:hypothetical protein